MDQQAFKKWSKELQMWCNELAAKAEPQLSQALEFVEGRKQLDPTPNPQGDAKIVLDSILERITDVMGVYDKLLETIDMSPQFQEWFDIDNLTPEGRRQLRELLKTHVGDESDGSR